MGAQVEVVDLGPWLGAGEVDREEAVSCAHLMVRHMKEEGCVLLTNHGLDLSQSREIIDKFEAFFAHSEDEKLMYLRSHSSLVGYHPQGSVRANLQRQAADLTEGFNFKMSNMKPQDYPESWVPGIQQMVERHNHATWRLGRDILQAMAVGLGLQDEYFFTRAFTSAEMNVIMRYNLYRPVQEPSETDVRLGEHRDTPALTLLYTDNKQGLQVERIDGSWMDVVPGPGELVMFTGTLMQRWTAGALPAAKHRVVVPEGPDRLQPRRSLASFMMPDDEAVVQSLGEPSEAVRGLDLVVEDYTAKHVK